jgi:hypothetical protein
MKPPKFDALVKGAVSVGSNWNKVKDGVASTEPQKKRRRAMVRPVHAKVGPRKRCFQAGKHAPVPDAAMGWHC